MEENEPPWALSSKKMNLSVSYLCHLFWPWAHGKCPHRKKWDGLGRWLREESASWPPRSHIQARGGIGVTLGEWRKVDLEGSLPMRTTEWERSKFSERPSLREIQKGCRSDWGRYPNTDSCLLQVQPWMSTSPNTQGTQHTQTHTHRENEKRANCKVFDTVHYDSYSKVIISSK